MAIWLLKDTPLPSRDRRASLAMTQDLRSRDRHSGERTAGPALRCGVTPYLIRGRNPVAEIVISRPLHRHNAGVIHLRQRFDFSQHLIRQGVIQSHHHHCLSTGSNAAHFHEADVDVVPASGGAHRANDAGLVLVVNEQHVGRGRRHVHPVVIHADQVRLVAQRRTGDGDVVAGGVQRRGDQAGVLPAVAGGLLGDL